MSNNEPIDFEQDDFANDKEIQKIRSIQKKYDEMIQESIETVRKEFSLEDEEPEAEIEDSILIKSFDSPNINESLKSSNKPFELQVYLVEYSWESRAGRSHQSGRDEMFIGSLSLNKSFPPTCIFKETLATIITDWFTKQDVDFKEQKLFSRKFHVISEDKDKLQLLLFNKQLDDLALFPEMEAEIKNNKCFFRVSGNSIDEEEVKKFIELTKVLVKILL